MTINEKINTTLTYQDTALIAVALGMYQDQIKNNKDDMYVHASNLVNRLGNEMSSYPKMDFTNN